MYAIIKIGGKQYRVAKDDVIDVDLFKDSVGETIEFEDILFLHDGETPLVGGPTVKDYVVRGELLGVSKGPKVRGINYKARHHHNRKFGHRQKYSRIRITGIEKLTERRSHGS